MTAPVQQPTPATPTATAPPPTEDGVAAEVAVVLAAFAGAVLTAAAIERLVALLRLLRIKRRFVTLTVTIMNRDPLRETVRRGVVSRDNARQSTLRRAWFLIASARRLERAATEARSRGEPVGKAVTHAARAEARYWQQHKQAEQRRAQAAADLDAAAAVHGTVLQWRSRRDSRVTPACRAADGHVFSIHNPPRIGLPGLGVHVNCRCWAVKVRRRAGQMTVDQALAAAGMTGLE